jgi:predicted Zn-dependent protease
MGLYDDADYNAYLNRIGQRLVQVNPDQTFDYSFAVVDQYEPNAFALPGGYIYVSRGLLALTNSEDELAGVVGHEIIHVSRRHSARQMAKARAPALLSLPGAVVGGVINDNLGRLINAPVNAIGGGYLASHSRQDEFESDQFGQQLSASAGYDPTALAPMLARLEAFVEVETGEKRIPGFFDTHPTTPDRVARVERDAQSIQWARQPGIAPGTKAYLRKLDGLLIGDNPGMGVFQDGKFLHPELDLSLTLPKGWKTLNTRQAVFAVAPKEDGILAMAVAGKGSDPEQPADRFETALYNKYRIRPTESKTVKIGKLPAYLSLYTDNSGREPMHLAFLWVGYRGLIYQFIGLAPEKYRKLLRATALSFRPMTSTERKSITETRLRVVSARSNESLTQLSKRKRNAWDIRTTAVMNGIDVKESLREGQLIKIAVIQPYRY